MNELVIEAGRAERQYWRDLWRYRMSRFSPTEIFKVCEALLAARTTWVVHG
jgi:hypothetical protein